MSDSDDGSQTDNAAPQVENQGQVAKSIPTEISALRNYREAQAAKSQGNTPTPAARNPDEGGSGPNDAAQNQSQDREQWIPRDRFDQVNQQKNQYQQQAEQMRQQVAQLSQMQQFAQQQPGFQGQPQQQFVGQTGMVHTPQAPQPQQAPAQSQAQAALPDFSNPEVEKQWRNKIAKDPIKGLGELFDIYLTQKGQPLLQQYAQQIQQQIQPLRQNYIQTQLNQYAQTRANDPEFAQIRPQWEQAAQRAIQLGYDLSNPQTMATVEFVAKQTAQQQGQFQPQTAMPQPQPFSERPGNSSTNLGAGQRAPNLSPQQREMAKRFHMTEQQYADSLTAFGVKTNG